ncbi:MAG: chemotaxis protein CheB [Nannocystales bacterium]
MTPKYVDVLARRVWAEFGCAPVETVTDVFDAVDAFGPAEPTHVVIDGELDARGGVRIASALASRREVPTVLVVDPELREEVGQLLKQRQLDHVRVVCWEDDTVRCLFERESTAGKVLRPDVSVLAEQPYDAVMLFGSAGTPHMLPTLVPKLRRTVVPLVVAVHHNPRLSESFAEWIGELANMHPRGLREGSSLGSLTVVRAQSGVDALQPHLGAVLAAVHARGARLLIIVASGMQFEGVEALQLAVRDGAGLAALKPESCPQPAMVHRLLDAGLDPVLCTQEEIAQLIRRATGAGRSAFRHAG